MIQINDALAFSVGVVVVFFYGWVCGACFGFVARPLYDAWCRGLGKRLAHWWATR